MHTRSDNAREQFIKMTKTPVESLIVKLAAPTICSMLITSFYNMADTFFVARIGTSAAGAVGVVFSLMAIIQAIGFMLGMGAGSLASRKLGEKKNDEACAATSSAFFLALILSSIVSVIGLTYTDKVMTFLGSTETILPYSRQYAKWILLGAPIMATSFVMNTNLRAEGKAFFAMIGIVTGGVLNVILDPIFIFGFKLGISGAAIATLISQCISFSILLSHFIFHRTILKINIRRVSHSINFYFLIIRTGLPTLFRQGLGAIASITLNNCASVYGDVVLAAMAIVMRVSMFTGSIVIGFGQGFQPVAGYNYGAKRFDRVVEAYKFCVKTGTVVLIFLSAIYIFFAPQIIGLFKNADSRVSEIAVFAFRANCASLVFMPITCISDMLFQVTGRIKESSFLAGARRGLFFIPIVCTLPHFIGLTGIQISQPLAELVSVTFAVPMVYKYIAWLKAQPITKDDGMDNE